MIRFLLLSIGLSTLLYLKIRIFLVIAYQQCYFLTKLSLHSFQHLKITKALLVTHYNIFRPIFEDFYHSTKHKSIIFA